MVWWGDGTTTAVAGVTWERLEWCGGVMALLQQKQGRRGRDWSGMVG